MDNRRETKRVEETHAAVSSPRGDGASSDCASAQHFCHYTYLRGHKVIENSSHVIPLASLYPSYVSLRPQDEDGVCLVFTNVMSCAIDVFDVKLNQTNSWEKVQRVAIPNESKLPKLTAYVSFLPVKDRNILIRRVLSLQCQAVQAPGEHIIGGVDRCPASS